VGLRRFPPFWAWGWLFLVAAMLLIRPPLPIDETRYLSVAWNMWHDGSLWVPLLNGHTYDGKPPLFFWLVELGWLVFGVSDWWGRLVAPLFGLLALWITSLLARRLWPQTPQAAVLAPTLALGALYWAVFGSSSMIDMLLVAFVVLAAYMLVVFWQQAERRYAVFTGIALGLGVLAKGPVVLLPIAGIALLAPWWMGEARPAQLTWGRWYRGLLLSLGVALLVSLIWLVPMMIQAGPEYFLDMVLYQTAGYMGSSGPVAMNGHHRPLWWYLPLLPVLLFPWSLWPATWRAMRLRGLWHDPAVRLCMAWAAPMFVVLSVIAGKQPHYLLPLFPPLALLAARGLAAAQPKMRFTVPGLAYVLVGALWLALPLLARGHHAHAPWLSGLSLRLVLTVGGALLLLGGLLVTWRRPVRLEAGVRTLAASTWIGLLVVIGGIFNLSWPAYDLRPASAFLRQAAARGEPVAILDSGYQGQFNFFGRLTHPVKELNSGDLPEWIRKHGSGYVIAYYNPRKWSPSDSDPPAYQQLYRAKGLAIWSSAQLQRHPQLLKRIE
jgi:4-amino-4-deoxy-L-arabinose transferase-like glycosyltransferase